MGENYMKLLSFDRGAVSNARPWENAHSRRRPNSPEAVNTKRWQQHTNGCPAGGGRGVSHVPPVADAENRARRQ